jgi:hypothetical protein
VSRRPNRLQASVDQLNRFAIPDNAVRLRVYAEATMPTAIVVPRRDTVPKARQQPLHPSMSGGTREAHCTGAVSRINLGTSNAVAHQPIIGMSLPVIEAKPARLDPLPLALKHDQLSTQGVFLHPDGQTQMIWVRMRDDQHPDIQGLATARTQLLPHRAGRIFRAVASIQPHDVVRVLEEIGHHIGDPGGVRS